MTLECHEVLMQVKPKAGGTILVTAHWYGQEHLQLDAGKCALTPAEARLLAGHLTHAADTCDRWAQRP